MNYFTNEAGGQVQEVVIMLFRWVTCAGLICMSVNTRTSRSIVLLNDVRMNALTIVFVVNSKPSLSKET